MKPNRSSKFTGIAIVILMLPALTGCGTILFGGTTERINVTAEPGGAAVTTIPVSGEFTTPVTIELQ